MVLDLMRIRPRKAYSDAQYAFYQLHITEIRSFYSLFAEVAEAEFERRSGKAEGPRYPTTVHIPDDYIPLGVDLFFLPKTRESGIHLCAFAAGGRRVYIAPASSCGTYVASTMP